MQKTKNTPPLSSEKSTQTVSVEGHHAATQTIVKTIAQDASQEAAAIIAKAQESAQQQLEQAKKDAENTQSQISRQTQEDIQKIEKKIFSRLNLETKKIILNSREQVVQRVIKRLYEELMLLRKSPAYKKILQKLIIEAACILHEKELIIIINKEDAGCISAQCINECVEQLEQQHHLFVSLSVSQTTFHTKTGIIAQRKDSRLQYDNTFEEKILRYNDEIRLRIAQRMFGA